MNDIDQWRGLVLYGRNVATYKIALAAVLLDEAAIGRDHITLPDLAERFFKLYCRRLENGKRQISVPGRYTLLERVIGSYRSDDMTEGQAIETIERAGFNDVIPRFHNLDSGTQVTPFYVQDGATLKLSDNLMDLAQEHQRRRILHEELDSRWSLLEAAFDDQYKAGGLATDGANIFHARYLERVNITSVSPVLNAYQNGYCFYCGDPLVNESVHVDHVIPRAFIQHDEIWNLVLAHASCNLKKHASLPPLEYMDALHRRNEYYIASNHPIKQHLLRSTGTTKQKRAAFLSRSYSEAKLVLLRCWSPRRIAVLPDPLRPLNVVTE